MKKFLLLLLLPSIVLAQDSESLQIKKPRKLFVEIKQGLLLPSIGLKYKNKKGDYWNVGLHSYDVNFAKTIVGTKIAGTIDGFFFAPSLYHWMYISYDQKIQQRLFLEHGANLTILAFKDDFYFPSIGLHSGIYYGNRISVGLKLGLAFNTNHSNHKFTMVAYFFPKIKLRI